MMNTSLTKVRPNDVLGNLPVNDQERILDWCDHEPYRDVMEKIALPAPEGLGLKIHYNSLRNFYLKHLPRRTSLKREESLNDWELLAEAAEYEEVNLGPLLREFIQKQLFLMVNEPELNHKQLMFIFKAYARMKDHELSAKKLKLTERLHSLEDPDPRTRKKSIALDHAIAIHRQRKRAQAAADSPQPHPHGGPPESNNTPRPAQKPVVL